MAACWCLSRHRSQDIKWGGKQHPSMTNPLHLCFWHKVCTSLTGHGEEESGLQWIVKLDRVLGADLERSQTPPGSKKKRRSGLHALLSSQIPPVLCTMRLSAPKLAWLTALAPAWTKEGCGAKAELCRVQGV